MMRTGPPSAGRLPDRLAGRFAEAMQTLGIEPLVNSNSNVVFEISRAATRIVVTVLWGLQSFGEKNVPRRGGVILAANHASYLDPVLVGVRVWRPIAFFAKSELFRNWFFGWLISRLYAFPVRQGDADVGAVRQAIARLNEGYALNIFPEGGRTPDGKLQKIQSGVALIARRSGAPVVPVAIVGSFEVWPRRLRLPGSGRVRVMYGQPVDVSNLKADAIARLLTERIGDMIDQLRRRSHP